MKNKYIPIKCTFYKYFYEIKHNKEEIIVMIGDKHYNNKAYIIHIYKGA